MDFVLKLVALIISFSLVQPKETIKVWKSIKLNEKMIYDCVDIYKQPSLNHPLLKNHKIQMEPSFAIPKSKNQVESKSEEICPNGTVPILRNTKEYVANAQYFAEKHFNPFTAESHGGHIAGVRLRGQYRGISSHISVHDLNISRDQASYTNMYVGMRVNNSVNYIQTGWMINPSLYGDSRTWGYGYWKGANGAGCYNTICPGFIQVSKTKVLSGPLDYAPEGKRNMGITLQQDKDFGNWWVTDVKYKVVDVAIGYWPKELFDVMNKGVNLIGVGGLVHASPSGKSPPMGNGHLPTGDDMESARVGSTMTYDSDHRFYFVDRSEMEYLLDSKQCYGVKRGKTNLITFGGPGGSSCGI